MEAEATVDAEAEATAEAEAEAEAAEELADEEATVGPAAEALAALAVGHTAPVHQVRCRPEARPQAQSPHLAQPWPGPEHGYSAQHATARFHPSIRPFRPSVRPSSR